MAEQETVDVTDLNRPSKWFNLESRHTYRHLRLYDQGTRGKVWKGPSGEPLSDVEIEGCLVAVAPNGGPVALVRDPKKARRQARPEMIVWIFSAAGGFISRWEWPRGARTKLDYLGESAPSQVLQNIGWTKRKFVQSTEEVLVTVADDGTVTFFDTFGRPRDTVSLISGEDMAGYHVVTSCIREQGIVALISAPTDEFGFRDDAEGRDVKTPRLVTLLRTERAPRVMYDFQDRITKEPYDMVWKPVYGDGAEWVGIVVRIAARESAMVWTVTRMSDHVPTVAPSEMEAPVTKLSYSPNGSFCALYTGDGYLMVLLERKEGSTIVLRRNTESREPPNQMVWISSVEGGVQNDACVCLCWVPSQFPRAEDHRSLLVLIAPSDSESREGVHHGINMQGTVQAIEECDGVRLIGDHGGHLVQKVPEALLNVHASDNLDDEEEHPAHELRRGWNMFSSKQSGGLDILADLTSSALVTAVETCVEAAGHSFDVPMQKELLRAAAFGQSFCKVPNPDRLSAMTKDLRVLNALWKDEIGIPMTWVEYNLLGMDGVVSALISRELFFHADRIGKHLGLRPQKVLVAWACAKVRNDKPAAEIAAEIEAKFQACPGVSRGDVAMYADHLQNRELVKLLLESEPKASDQVALLVSFKMYALAVEKALSSGDPELVATAVLGMHLQKDQKFQLDMLGEPANAEAKNLFAVCAQYSPVSSTQKLLSNLQKATSSPSVRGLASVERFLDRQKCPDFNAMRLTLISASDCFMEDKTRGVDAKCVKDQLELLNKQIELDTFQPSGATLAKTLEHLIMKKKPQADKLRKEFNVPTRMFEWIKLRSLCKAGLWSDLEQWALKTRLDIGIEAVVNECLKYDKEMEAEKYVRLVKDPGTKCSLLCRLQLFPEAKAVAGDNEAWLQLIRSEQKKREGGR
eukprot:TRINITY_DN40791_c0_g1_i1.p1 TRINITY_DN40791_c0_g1~~TRINITY_DN40791_c0_g1_i1.p1  ORF type:complete len:917 (+),score=271.07 TRINITY_DN40791_c0_g1_i1:88-2838(+)